jgi:hypothetical protein
VIVTVRVSLPIVGDSPADVCLTVVSVKRDVDPYSSNASALSLPEIASFRHENGTSSDRLMMRF